MVYLLEMIRIYIAITSVWDVKDLFFQSPDLKPLPLGEKL